MARRRRLLVAAMAAGAAAVVGIGLARRAAPEEHGAARPAVPPAPAAAVAPAPAPAPAAPAPAPARSPPLDNLAAYIPPQCYAVTSDAAARQRTHNGCFACHQASQPPNYVDDADVQTALSLPRYATANRWTNLLRPPPPAQISDEALLAWVRTSNYRDADGAPRLARSQASWDRDGNGRWDGARPDCWFRADAEGWDRDAAGRPTGWRAYAYAPMPGMFWPTNGSFGDAFVRLPDEYRRDADGQERLAVYAINLAILEAYIRRTDVPIPPVDERALAADLDGDGSLGTARKVAFVWPPPKGRPRLHYVGQAAALDPEQRGWPAAGLYPAGTEILHSVRYLDVAGGKVQMAARMKELRYMRKERWLTYSDLDQRAKLELREKMQKPDKLKLVLADPERGVATGTGWRMQAFIEDARGELRPQTVEETTACIGCHGGVGATADSTFSFARKVGWYHWEARGLSGIAEPRRADGRGEYVVWLEEVGGGDDFLANAEVAARFFGPDGKLVPQMASAMARDISLLAVPSPARALALDRAYLGLVAAQSFARGRDVVLGAPRVHERVAQDAPTGVAAPVAAAWQSPAPARSGSGR